MISPAAARVIPFAVYIAFVVLQSAAGDSLAQGTFDARWFYGGRFCVVAGLLWYFRRHYTELQTFAGVSGGRLLASIGAGFGVFLLWINLDFGWAVLGKPAAFDPTLADGSGVDTVAIVFRLMGMAVMVPIMEELFWRSYILRRLDRFDFLALHPAKASLYAVLVCATLFSLEHSSWLAGLAAGLVYTVVYMRSGNLWLPVNCHATTNAALGAWVVTTGHWRFW